MKKIKTVSEIAPLLQVSTKTVYGYINRYKEELTGTYQEGFKGRTKFITITNPKKFIKICNPRIYEELKCQEKKAYPLLSVK